MKSTQVPFYDSLKLHVWTTLRIIPVISLNSFCYAIPSALMVLGASYMHETLCPRISYPCLMGGCLVTRWPVNTHNIIMTLLDDLVLCVLALASKYRHCAGAGKARHLTGLNSSSVCRWLVNFVYITTKPIAFCFLHLPRDLANVILKHENHVWSLYWNLRKMTGRQFKFGIDF